MEEGQIMHEKDEGARVPQRSKVQDVESVDALAGDGPNAEAWGGAERTVERMGGFSREQRKGVVAVEGEQGTAEVSRVRRIALALALAAVRVDTEVHAAPSAFPPSVGARPAQDNGDRHQQNPQIESERPSVDVFEIHPH